MGRREQRAEMQRTWNVYEPRVGSRPFTAKDLEDAEARAQAEVAEVKRLEALDHIVFVNPELPPTVSVRTHLPTLARAAQAGAVMARPNRPSGGEEAPASSSLVDLWRREIDGQRSHAMRDLAIHDLTLDENDNIVPIAVEERHKSTMPK